MPVSSDTSIFVGNLDNTAWVRIVGVATKDTSACIRRYFSEKFSQGLRNFVIDLGQCRLIDSTFIGILTGLAGNIAEEGNSGEVKVIHTNERNEKSICKLGLDNLITIDREGSGSEEMESRIGTSLNLLAEEELDKVEKTTMILRAHENICSANEENEEEFVDVLELLRVDLDKSAGN